MTAVASKRASARSPPRPEAEQTGRRAPPETQVPGMRMAAQEGMWLEAILTREDLLDAFCKLSPLEIRFGQNGTLRLSAPTAVAMNPGKSVAVVCDPGL